MGEVCWVRSVFGQGFFASKSGLQGESPHRTFFWCRRWYVGMWGLELLKPSGWREGISWQPLRQWNTERERVWILLPYLGISFFVNQSTSLLLILLLWGFLWLVAKTSFLTYSCWLSTSFSRSAILTTSVFMFLNLLLPLATSLSSAPATTSTVILLGVF